MRAATITLVGDVPRCVDPVLAGHRVTRVPADARPQGADFVLIHERAGRLSGQVTEWMEALRDESVPFGYATPQVDRERLIHRTLEYAISCNLEGNRPSAVHLSDAANAIGLELQRPPLRPEDIAIGSYFAPREDYEQSRVLSLLSPRSGDLIRQLSLAIASMDRTPLPPLPWDPTERVPSQLSARGSAVTLGGGLPRLSDVFAAGRTDRARALLRADEVAAARSEYPKPAMALIRGESGSGKSLIAELMWQAFASKAGWVTPARPMPFVKVNCGGMTAENFDHLLVGAAADSFTDVGTTVGLLPQADYGVVFLDEFGDLHPSAQSRFKPLLDDLVIQPAGLRPYYLHLRVIAATNAPLETSGFQHDLQRRFTVELTAPSLNERGDAELRRLIDFAAQNPAANPPFGAGGFEVTHLAPGAVEELLRHDWTEGNFRELCQVVERSISEVLKRHGRVVERADVVKSFVEKASPARDERVVSVMGEVSPRGEMIEVASRRDLLRASVIHDLPILRGTDGNEWVRTGTLTYLLRAC